MTTTADADAKWEGRVVDLLDRLGRTLRQLEFNGGLNPVHWEALRYLARANRISRTPGALASYLGTTRGTASQTLICLESKGYVQKVRCLNDRRVTFLELTRSGRKLLQEDPLRRVDEMVGSMPADVEDALRSGLSRLLGRLAEDDDCRAFGVCARCDLLEESAESGKEGDRRCGLTGDPLSDADIACICADFKCPEEGTA